MSQTEKQKQSLAMLLERAKKAVEARNLPDPGSVVETHNQIEEGKSTSSSSSSSSSSSMPSRTQESQPLVMEVSFPPEPGSDAWLASFFTQQNKEPNPEQMAFIRQVLSGKNCILIGAAGTGKTTTQAMAGMAMLATNHVQPLHKSTKYLTAGTPGLAICSFTNKAVNNIRWKMPEEFKNNCLTIHKLLEFGPKWYEVLDPISGEMKKTVRFEPQRNRMNPLPSSLQLLIIEEASMPSLELYQMLEEAMPHPHQTILLGDIHQLPPVMSSISVLGEFLDVWPITELKRIYRQGEGSPIIDLAWKIKNGETLSSETEIIDGRKVIKSFQSLAVPNKLSITPWQKRIDELQATMAISAKFKQLHQAGAYDPDEDIILIPFNKAFGTLELNKKISQYLGELRGAVVHEIIAGYNKHYLAVGDKVMFQKEDAYITDIIRNADYLGGNVQPASKTLDRWGHNENEAEDSKNDSTSVQDIDVLLNSLAENSGRSEDRVTKSSHTVVIRRVADGEIFELDSAAAVNDLLGGYVITIHKAQGSEWRKVFFITHWTHQTMLQRELLYTAVTRAREELHIICEPDTFEKGIRSQKIKGTTLPEKIQFLTKKKKEIQQRQRIIDLVQKRNESNDEEEE